MELERAQQEERKRQKMQQMRETKVEAFEKRVRNSRYWTIQEAVSQDHDNVVAREIAEIGSLDLEFKELEIKETQALEKLKQTKSQQRQV